MEHSVTANALPADANIVHMGCAGFSLADVTVTPDPSGALWIASEQALVVSDLHFEKGSAFAERRVMLPPYDTAATLARLTAVIARWNPRVVVALGDSFHDRRAEARMAGLDREGLRSLTTGRDWIWIAGNHDPAPPEAIGGEAVAELRFGALTLRHEPLPGASPGEIAGHLHPVARVWSQSGSIRRRCFVSDGERCVMPAFGAYAGGLNIRDDAFHVLFGNAEPYAHTIGRDKIYRVPMSRCPPERN